LSSIYHALSSAYQNPCYRTVSSTEVGTGFISFKIQGWVKQRVIQHPEIFWVPRCCCQPTQFAGAATIVREVIKSHD
jgi:hypothetical protein